jgi:hypothetical protein
MRPSAASKNKFLAPGFHGPQKFRDLDMCRFLRAQITNQDQRLVLSNVFDKFSIDPPFQSGEFYIGHLEAENASASGREEIRSSYQMSLLRWMP